MKDNEKTREQLIHELTELRSQNAAQEKSITENISAQIVAEELQHYAENIVETILQPLLVLDGDLKIISANRNFYSTFNVNPGETLGCFIYDLGNKQWDIPKLRELLERVLPEKEAFYDFEVDHNFQDIGQKIMLLNARQIYRKDIGIKIILLAIEDITTRKRLEDLLAESEERYRRLFETASDGIVLLEKSEGKITHANPATETMLGYTNNESIGNNLQGIGVLLDMDDFQTTMQNLNKSGILNYNDVPVITKSGQHIDTDIYLVDRARLVQCNIRNITERKQAEESLRESDRVLLESQRLGHIGSWYQTIAGPILWSEELYRIYGVSPETFTPTVASLLSLIHLDDQPRMQAWIDTCWAGGNPRELDYRIKRPDGKVRFIRGYGGASYDAGGVITHIAGTAQDITEGKISEEALESSLSLLSASLESTADGILIVDRVGKITRWNQKFADMWKIPKDVISGRDDEKATKHVLMQLADPEQFVAKIRKLYEHPEESSFDQIEFSDGRVFERYSQPQRIKNNVLGRVWSFRDITERKQAEEKIQQISRFPSENPNPVMRISAEGILEYANDSSKELLSVMGFEIGSQVSAEWQARISETLVSGRPTNVEFQAGDRIFSATLGPVVDRGYANLYATDITERKHAEAERIKLEGQLQQAQKMESVGRLAGGVAHDFNNMLGLILGHAEMALDHADPALPIHADLQEIIKAAERSADLTRQLLAFARQQTVQPKVLDLNKIVGNMLKMLQRLIGEDIDLKWQSAADLWSIKMDPTQIDQILANMCINARDAISDTGNITIETGNTNLDEAYCADHVGFAPGDYVKLIVSDDGCGMKKETAEHIFEPFFTTKGMGKGTGLGLSMVYGIVRQNNGFINVYSEPGQGTTFTVYFPRYIGKDEKEQTKPQEQKTPMRGQETLLLVEDEPALLELNKMILEKQGYRVLATGSPNKAIRLAGEYTGEISLLMTDVVMPEMNGRDLAKHLMTINPHLKCLFTSGYTADVIAHHGVLDEGVYFIQKPFSRQDLSAKVREVLEQK